MVSHNRNVPLKKRHGFTLIEVLITISISGLLFTLGFTRYNEFNKTQTVKGVANTVKNNLRNIQALALSGNKPNVGACAVANNRLSHYVVTFSNTSYGAQAVCNGAASGPLTTYTMPSGFTLSLTPAAPTSMNFLVLGQGANINKTLTIRGYTSPVRYYSLCLAQGGDIKDCGYRVGSPPNCVCP